MWSVVTESPNAPGSARRVIGWIGPGSRREVDQERRLLDVGAVGVPVVQFAFARLDGVPLAFLFQTSPYCFFEHLGQHALVDDRLHFGVRGPDVAEVHGRAVFAGAERFVVEVDVGGAGQGIGDDQRRAGQVVGFHIGIDAAFEVAVAGEHAGDDQVVFLDGFGDRLGQRAAVADAGRAAVADGVEAELFEVLVEAGFSK